MLARAIRCAADVSALRAPFPALLPRSCYLAGCTSFLALAGSTYLSRLWCIVEIFVFVSMGALPSTIEMALLQDDVPVDTFDTMQVLWLCCGSARAAPRELRSALREEAGPQRPSRLPCARSRPLLLRGRAATGALQARCFKATDQERLLAIVEAAAGGVDGFNR